MEDKKKKSTPDQAEVINGLGLILDLISCCLSQDSQMRPDLLNLIHSDLFKFDKVETQLVQKFSYNTLDYFAPEHVIIKQMLYPLRNICSKVIQSEVSIMDYENFIAHVIQRLDYFFFDEDFNTSSNQTNTYYNKENHEFSNNSNQHHSEESSSVSEGRINRKIGSLNKDKESVIDLSKKNSQIIRCVIDNKIIDILIFLVMRQFHIKLDQFKKWYHSKIQEEVKSIKDKKTEFDYKKQKAEGIREEMEEHCCQLIKALIALIEKCVWKLVSNEHMISFYVESIVEWVIKLYIGEDYGLLSTQLESKVLKNDPHYSYLLFENLNLEEGQEGWVNQQILNEKIRKNPDALKANIVRYLDLRTFMRTVKMVNKDFQEDEADKMWSLYNNNLDLCFKKSYWSPELHYLVSPLFKMTITESGSGFYKLPVLKNFFSKESESELTINPFINKDLHRFINLSNIKNIITLNYVNEIFALSECAVNLSSNTDHLSSKKSALTYFTTVFRSKNLDKIRACFDFKMHHFMVKYLNTSNNILRLEALLIFKEISLSLVDMNELSWMFGSNYNMVIEKTLTNKSEPLDQTDFSKSKDWGRDFSLVQFLNTALNSDHSYILLFSERFLGKNKDYTKVYTSELSKVFTSPLYLKSIIRSLSLSSEAINTRKMSLEILFNLMLSNNDKLIFSLNSTLCNFYETLIKLISQHNLLSANNQNYNLGNNDNLNSSQIAFNQSLKSVVSILIRMQNPLIKDQIFQSKAMLKYMAYHSIEFNNKYEFEQIENYLREIYVLVDFRKEYSKINEVIDSLKCWIQYYFTESGERETYRERLREMMTVFVKVFNIEWRAGMESFEANRLVFNIVKLFEWLCKKELQELLFSGYESAGFVISIMTKVGDVYRNIVVDEMSLVSLKQERPEKKEIKKAGNMNANMARNNTNTKLKTQSIKQKVSVNQISGQDRDAYNTVKGTETRSMYDNNTNSNSGVTSNIDRKEVKKEKPQLQSSSNIPLKHLSLIKIYHFLAIKLQNIILSIFNKNVSEYNHILEKARFGMLLAEVFYAQYRILSQLFNEKKSEINLLNNYIHESKVRVELFESLAENSNNNIKNDFLDTDFLDFLVSKMMADYRRFFTDFKKLSVEFLVFKECFPIRMEAVTFISIMIKKSKLPVNKYFYDELVKNFKKHKLIQRELMTIKDSIKGPKIHAVFLFLSMVLYNENSEITKILIQENGEDYLNYAVMKDISITRHYPTVVRFLNQMKQKTIIK